MKTASAVATGILGLLLAAARVDAEPYLAVASGFKCAVCHTNPTGGGKRTAFGAGYARSTLASRVVSPAGGDGGGWTGEINRWLALGGDLRGGLDYVDTPGADTHSEFGISRGTLYLELRAIPDLLAFYVDQQVAPGGTINREAYALLTPAAGKYTVKAGKFFLPYGLRLQDDSAFIRQVTGINFDTPDNGVELGLELDRWSAQVALTNGTAGGPDNDSTKQVSLMASYVLPRWRFGASYNFNNAALGDREMQGVFAGLRTGPIAWLAELDYVVDDTATGEQELLASLIEGNWRLAQGHNLKVTYEHFDPDDNLDDDERERLSLVWEYSPFQHAQVRIGVRAYDGVVNVAATNRDELFAKLHIYF